ncbi:PAS domain S-box protein [Geomonas terrae]|uniref:PAS domain S-box protein n=1 Tax=Geomonas terrae TaxID=2562681 RepID=A0A4S1CKE2_9BACT|nr:PAS domain-containing protein [Geomonas terrae]TGU74194.1 PAS domain S-box protein [Geomonas terrae]
MTFARRLKVSAFLSLTLLLVVASLLAWTSRELNMAGEKHALADRIQSVVFQRATMRDEYFLYGVERARLQWFSLTEKTAHLVDVGHREFGDNESREAMKRLTRDLAESQIISRRLAERMRGVPGVDPAFVHHDEFAGRLYSQIMLKDSALQQEAVNLQKSARERFEQATQRMITLTLVLVFLMALGTIVNSVYLNAVLHRRMMAVKEAADQVAAGNLDHRIVAEGTDELAEMSRVFNSVTQQVQDYTKALHDSEQRYRMQLQELANVYTHTPVGLFVVDRDLRFLRLNERLAEMNCKSICEHVGRTIDEVLSPEITTQLKEIWRPVFERGECIRNVELHGRADASQKQPRHWLANYQPILSTGGEVTGLMGVVLDITERKAAEEVMAGARQQLEEEVHQRTAKLQLTNKHLLQEIKIRKKIEVELLTQQQKLQDMALDLAMAEERERDRIASELHDQVGQRLILAKIKLDALASNVPTGECESEAEGIGGLIEQTLQDIRSLTFQLRPPLLASAGLEAALRWLGEELYADFGLQVEFSDDGKEKTLRYEIRSTVFQAVRELMLNVAKHAGTMQCRVALLRSNGFLVVQVDDDGVGLNGDAATKGATREGGFGLLNVRQKIEHLGGAFSIVGKAAGGTLATVTVPLDGF